jgi:hypothetical protein
MAHHHHVEHAHLLVGELVLLEVGHALAGIERDIAGGGFQHAGEYLHEGGLARAIGADQAVAIALGSGGLGRRLELHGLVFEEILQAVLAQFAAVAGLLVAAEGRVDVEGPPLISTWPVRRRRATASARASVADQTPPERP